MEKFIRKQGLNPEIEDILMKRVSKYPHSALERFYQTFEKHIRLAQKQIVNEAKIDE